MSENLMRAFDVERLVFEVRVGESGEARSVAQV